MHYIREWALDDAADIAQALNNPNVQNNLRDGIPYPYTAADGAEYISSVLAAPEDSQYAFAIQLGGKAVGSIGLFRQSNIHCHTAELGYYLAEEHWGKGIVTEAVKEACRFVFENTDILRIFAEPFATNQGSCKVLEKAGFTCEGTLRQNAVKNGQVQDMKMYALLR